MTSDQKPRLTSLFAGIGGFDLGFDRAGFTTAGQCEIDPHALSVLERHWPDAQRHTDVSTLRGLQFGPADVITFGSPCQDLSVAGKRAGLAGERSGLFTEAMRYIREMLEETNGQYPRAAIWENVPGAFSSNGGADFAAVLESMVGGTVRCPPDGWANAGVAFGPEGAAEWRVLDSQHFGVAQRRRRVFVVYHPGGERAGQVLLECQSVRRDSETGRPKGQGPAGTAESGAGDSRAIGLSGESNAAYELQPTLQHDSPTGGGQKPMVGTPNVMATMRAGGGNDTPSKGAVSGDTRDEYIVPVLNDQGGNYLDVSHGVSGTLRAESKGNHPIIPAVSPTVTSKWAKGTGGPAGDEVQNLVVAPPPVAFKIRGGVSVDSDGKGAGKGYLGSENMALTLGTVQDMFLAEPIGFDHAAGVAHGMSEREGTVPTLQASSGIGRAAVAFPIQDGRAMNKNQGGTGIGGPLDPSYTLDTTGAQAVAFALRGREEGAVPEVTGDQTSSLRGSSGGSSRDMVAFAQNQRDEVRDLGHLAQSYAVRRLTPTECERLQGFPDGHTALAADDREIADTHRYRMLGNAVTVPVAEWIGKRLYAILTGAAE